MLSYDMPNIIHVAAPLEIPNFWLNRDVKNKKKIDHHVVPSTNEYWPITFSAEMKEDNDSLRKRITPPIGKHYLLIISFIIQQTKRPNNMIITI